MLLKHFIVIVTMPPALGGMKKASNLFMALSSYWQFVKIQVIFKPNVCVQNF